MSITMVPALNMLAAIVPSVSLALAVFGSGPYRACFGHAQVSSMCLTIAVLVLAQPSDLC